jgi:hypothetical protein
MLRPQFVVIADNGVRAPFGSCGRSFFRCIRSDQQCSLWRVLDRICRQRLFKADEKASKFSFGNNFQEAARTPKNHPQFIETAPLTRF